MEQHSPILQARMMLVELLLIQKEDHQLRDGRRDLALEIVGVTEEVDVGWEGVELYLRDSMKVQAKFGNLLLILYFILTKQGLAY